MIDDQRIVTPAVVFLDLAADREDRDGILARRAAVLGMGLIGSDRAVKVLKRSWELNYYVNRETALALALARAYDITDDAIGMLQFAKHPRSGQLAVRILGELYSARRPPRTTWFLQGTNYTLRNDDIRWYQDLANEFLVRYLMGIFGRHWR